MSKLNPETRNSNQTPGGMNPVEKMDSTSLELIVFRANAAIAAFEKFMQELGREVGNEEVRFGDKQYDFYDDAVEEFAVSVFHAVVDNLYRYVVKVLNCYEDGDGYVIATDQGYKVLVQVWDTGVTGHLAAIPIEEADYCEEAK